MAADHTEFLALAREMIAAEGRSVTIQKLSSTPADVTKPWKGPGTPTVSTSRTVFAVFVPASGSGFGRSIVKEELLDRVEQVALIAPTDIPLNGFHTIVDDEVRWNIDWIEELKPGPLTVLYAIGVKR